MWYTGGLAPVEEHNRDEESVKRVNEHMNDLVSVILHKSGPFSYFHALIATSLATSICTVHPSAFAALRPALGPLTPEMLKTLSSALVASYREIPFCRSFRVFFASLFQNAEDREGIANILARIFSDESDSVCLDDIGLLAAITEAMVDVSFELDVLRSRMDVLLGCAFAESDTSAA